jgi:hypothetical protein
MLHGGVGSGYQSPGLSPDIIFVPEPSACWAWGQHRRDR